MEAGRVGTRRWRTRQIQTNLPGLGTVSVAANPTPRRAFQGLPGVPSVPGVPGAVGNSYAQIFADWLASRNATWTSVAVDLKAVLRLAEKTTRPR